MIILKSILSKTLPQVQSGHFKTKTSNQLNNKKMKQRKLTTVLALVVLLLCSVVQAQTSSTIPGRFPEASKRLLTDSDLRNFRTPDPIPEYQ